MRPIHGNALWLVCVLSSALASAAPAETGPAVDTSRSMLNPGAFTSAEVCGGCHKDIHAGWSTSVHAQSATNPAFTSALAKYATPGSRETARQCLGCHAPVTLVSKASDAEEPLAKEGITCSFCHSITEAKAQWSLDAFTLDPGQTMRGPFEYASSPGHLTAYSPLHRTARICAPCHQLRTAGGIAVLNTYEEWKSGPWPGRGVQCQDCHMAPVRGAVAEDIKTPAQASGQDRRIINLHRLVGGSALGQLRRALTATIRQATRNQGTIVVQVDVKNEAAGHRAPTGLPTRSIVLRLEASRNGTSFHRDERVYKRDLLDAAGKRIRSDADAFTRAVKTGTDTRLAPGESRTERFSFAAPPGETKLVLGLDYEVSQGAAAPARRERFQELTTDVK